MHFADNTKTDDAGIPNASASSFAISSWYFFVLINVSLQVSAITTDALNVKGGVGANVGESVGFLVSPASVGAHVGDSDGASVGSLVGSSVGSSVGSAVGSGVGTTFNSHPPFFHLHRWLNASHFSLVMNPQKSDFWHPPSPARCLHFPLPLMVFPPRFSSFVFLFFEQQARPRSNPFHITSFEFQFRATGTFLSLLQIASSLFLLASASSFFSIKSLSPLNIILQHSFSHTVCECISSNHFSCLDHQQQCKDNHQQQGAFFGAGITNHFLFLSFPQIGFVVSLFFACFYALFYLSSSLFFFSLSFFFSLCSLQVHTSWMHRRRSHPIKYVLHLETHFFTLSPIGAAQARSEYNRRCCGRWRQSKKEHRI